MFMVHVKICVGVISEIQIGSKQLSLFDFLHLHTDDVVDNNYFYI
jgi:hypothetical protein